MAIEKARGLAIVLVILATSLALVHAFQAQAPRALHHVVSHPRVGSLIPLYDAKKPESNALPSEEVNKILQRINDLVAPSAPSNFDSSAAKSAASQEDELTTETVDGQFNKLLEDLSVGTMSEVEKMQAIYEANMAMNEVKAGEAETITATPKARLDASLPKTFFYSEACAPYLIVHGKGSIGKTLMENLKGMGKSVDVRFADGDFLEGIRDSELAFKVRDAKTIILACDNKQEGGGGLFAAPESFTCVTSKGLKKLLNTVRTEALKKSDPQTIKVICLTEACKPSKGIASFLVGDTFDLSSEVILQCQQRGFGYSIVKVGKPIEDTAEYPAGARQRGDAYVGSGEEDVSTAKKAIFVTASRVEASEVTRVGVAVESLLRAATFPLANSTFSILSTPSSEPASDVDWDDEYSRLIGPELKRIPLKYASAGPTAARLGRRAERFKRPNSGLITPVEVERFANGVRIFFKPMESTYKSAKEEKDATSAEAEGMAVTAPVPKRAGGYLSPEEEKAREDASAGVTATTKPKPKPKKKEKPEGGLEIIVDDVSGEGRVRIRRFNMDRETVVKVESEAVLMKAFLSEIRSVENDVKILTQGL